MRSGEEAGDDTGEGFCDEENEARGESEHEGAREWVGDGGGGRGESREKHRH